MYDPINGWTKEMILARIEEEFTGYSYRCGHGCAYRSESGNKCAVGVFIPDEAYQNAFDTSLLNVTALLNNWPSLAPYMPLETSAMVYLQDVHDSNEENTKELLLSWVENNVKPDDFKNRTEVV